MPTIRLVTINPGYEAPEARHPASRVMRGDTGGQLAKATFDYDQASHEEFDYDPLGQHPQATGTLSAAFDFTVRRHCPRSGFIQPAFHAYSPPMGWWVSRDPLDDAEKAEGANLYKYVANNPLDLIDSEGLAYGGVWRGQAPHPISNPIPCTPGRGWSISNIPGDETGDSTRPTITQTYTMSPTQAQCCDEVVIFEMQAHLDCLFGTTTVESPYQEHLAAHSIQGKASR